MGQSIVATVLATPKPQLKKEKLPEKQVTSENIKGEHNITA